MITHLVVRQCNDCGAALDHNLGYRGRHITTDWTGESVMITLYGKVMSRAARCVWVLEELGVDYEHVPTDSRTGKDKTAEFLAINPSGKIPALKDGDVSLFESLGINLYLAQKYGVGTLWPEDAYGQARAVQWTLFAATEIEPPGAARLVEFIFKSEDERNQDILDAAAERAGPVIDVIEASLQKSRYLAGDTFTIADLNASATLEYLDRTGVDLRPWSKAYAWFSTCISRPANQRVTEMKKTS